jgi:BolA protein
MNRAERITAILTQHLQPIHLEVADVSHKHAGHAGARPGGETHYDVTLVAGCFAGMGKIQRHQAVYQLLAEELRTGLHALSIQADAPEN